MQPANFENDKDNEEVNKWLSVLMALIFIGGARPKAILDNDKSL
jgi:serine/threonine-protein kinase HipA